MLLIIKKFFILNIVPIIQITKILKEKFNNYNIIIVMKILITGGAGYQST